jgi:hypothetical protein
MGETLNRERLIQFLSNVDQEILNMCSGEGKFRPGVLHFEVGKNSCPVMNRLAVLKENPTKKNLDLFIELAAQDFGPQTADYFEGISRAIFKVEAVVSQPATKAFDVSVKDAFYDMFRTARIPMEPKQVEQIEVHALRLAAVMEQKIATTVGFLVGNQIHDSVEQQLGKLVANMQAKEEAANEELLNAKEAEALESALLQREREEARNQAAVENEAAAEARFAEARAEKERERVEAAETPNSDPE